MAARDLLTLLGQNIFVILSLGVLAQAAVSAVRGSRKRIRPVAMWRKPVILGAVAVFGILQAGDFGPGNLGLHLAVAVLGLGTGWARARASKIATGRDPQTGFIWFKNNLFGVLSLAFLVAVKVLLRMVLPGDLGTGAGVVANFLVTFTCGTMAGRRLILLRAYFRYREKSVRDWWKTLPQDSKLYLTGCGSGLGLSLVSSVVDLGVSPGLSAVTFGVGIGYLGLLAIFVWKRIQLNITISLATTGSMVLLWYVNAGFSGGAPYFFVFAFLTAFVLLRGGALVLVVLLDGVVVAGLFLAEYLNPGLSIPYADRASRYYDVSVAFFISLAGLMTGLKIVLNTVRRERAKIEEEKNKAYQLLVKLLPKVEQTEELALANQELANQASTDTLTGLANRRKLITQAGLDIDRTRRFGLTLAVLMFDIDHFKTVNDNWGHEMGDRVLVEVSRVISGMVRSIDTIARYGGDEFVVLLPGASLEDVLSVADRFRLVVEAMKFQTDDGKLVPLSVSVGVTLCEGDRKDISLRELLNYADSALYRAKTLGRNRVEMKPLPVSAGSGPPEQPPR